MIRKAILGAALACAVAAAAANPPLIAGAVSDAAIRTDAMPPRLSDYGFFANLAEQQPAARVTPYRLNTPLFPTALRSCGFSTCPRALERAAGARACSISPWARRSSRRSRSPRTASGG